MCIDIAKLFQYLEIFDYEKPIKAEEAKNDGEKEELKEVEVVENKNFKELCSQKLLDQKIQTFQLQAKESYSSASSNAQRNSGLSGMFLSFGKSIGKSIVNTVITKGGLGQ